MDIVKEKNWIKKEVDTIDDEQIILTLKKLIDYGFINLAISRNSFDNNIVQYEDNTKKLAAEQTLSYQSRESENKIS